MELLTTNKRFSERESNRIFRQILSAVEQIHKANIVHRDLKLENILLDKDRNVMICDFGLGRTFKDGEGKDMRTYCGTPTYAAAEMVAGIPYTGVKTDIWSLGVILFILNSGSRPFNGPTMNLMFNNIKEVKYKTPNHFSPGINYFI